MNSGTRAGVGSLLDLGRATNGQQYLSDVRFSTEDWLDDWELTAHLSYLYANFGAKFQVFADNAQLPIATDGTISNSLNSGLPRTLFLHGV